MAQRVEKAEAYDRATEAYLPAVFNELMGEKLVHAKAQKRGGFLCHLSLTRPTCDTSGLPRKQRDNLIVQLTERIRQELGSDTLIARRDTLAVSLFTETTSDGTEAHHVMRQMQRIARDVNSQFRLETRDCRGLLSRSRRHL